MNLSQSECRNDESETLGFASDGTLWQRTRWTWLEKSGSTDGHERHSAEIILTGLYYEPVLAFIRSLGRPAGLHPEDLAQDFFLMWLQKRRFSKAKRQKGKRFRSYLMRSITNFVRDEIRKMPTPGEARGPNVSIDSDEDSAPMREIEAPSASIADIFEDAWRKALLGKALAQLEFDYRTSGHFASYELYNCYIIKPILQGCEPERQWKICERVGLDPSNAAKIMERVRKDLLEIIRRGLRDAEFSAKIAAAELEEVQNYMSSYCIDSATSTSDAEEAVPALGKSTKKRLGELFRGREQEVTAFLIVQGVIPSNATWRDIDPVSGLQILARPDDFMQRVSDH